MEIPHRLYFDREKAAGYSSFPLIAREKAVFNNLRI
jgi:hypothetical protein